ncbi:MAG: hypothetical protein Q7U57_00775 [Methylovulum sp.]|nr:hypothetical protein [Methylovulum sp.]
MNKLPLKNTLLMAALLGLLTQTGLTSAGTLSGSLGAGSSVTDFYRVTCTTNANGSTDNLKVTLIDLAPAVAPMISVQVIKGILGKNATDAVDGNATYSPAAIVKGGNGTYDVRVNKTAVGAELYTLKYACLNSAGKNTGTAIATVQNQ